MGSFCAKHILFELKKYRGVIFHETEEGYNIWRGIDLPFQNWHKEFDKFWPEQWKVSKIFALTRSFWAKYIMFQLKKYKGVVFHETEVGCKIWRGINLSFRNWHKEFDKFWPEHSKVSKLRLLMSKVYIVWATKAQRSYLSWHWRDLQILKKNWLVVWKKTFGKFLPEHFDGILLSKIENVWP